MFPGISAWIMASEGDAIGWERLLRLPRAGPLLRLRDLGGCHHPGQGLTGFRGLIPDIGVGRAGGGEVGVTTRFVQNRTVRMPLMEREGNAGYFTWRLPLNTILKESFERTIWPKAVRLPIHAQTVVCEIL